MSAPSQQERDRAAWEHLHLQIEYLRRQSRWEAPKAVAMIALALAAMVAASRLTDLWWPPRPQTLTVKLEIPVVRRTDP
jgi:hypothetical protein